MNSAILQIEYNYYRLLRYLICALVVMVAAPTHYSCAAEPSSVLLPSGTYLESGGTDSNGNPSAELKLYNPDTRQIELLSLKLSIPRYGHTATVLPDGSILVLGGLGVDGHPVQSLELLDLSKQTDQLVDNAGLMARSQHRATVLTSGKVLITGGLSDAGTPIGQAELWNPRTRYAEGMHGSLITPRYNHAAQILANSPVLIQGGRDVTGQTVNSSELYDPLTQGFSMAQAASLPGQLALPAVAEVIPPANGFDVALDGWIVVRFNKPLKVGTLNSGTVTLLGPAGVTPVKVVPVEAGMLLFVTPSQQLQPGSKYTLFIKGATDSQGQLLPLLASSFSTTTLPADAGVAGQGITGIVAEEDEQSVSAPSPISPAATEMAANDEDWIPDAHNYKGEWKSGRAGLAKAHPPHRIELLRAYMRTELERDGRLTPSRLEEKLPKVASPAVLQGVTALIGQALKLNGLPLAGVTVSMDGHEALTDANGEFILANLQPGLNKILIIDGATSDVGNSHYGRYIHRMHIDAGKVNALRQPIWLTKLDMQNAVGIPSPTVHEVVVTNPKLPGLEVHIPAGVVIRDAMGKPVTQISLTPVPVDQMPFEMPYGDVPVYYTLQPGGAVIQSVNGTPQGATVVYPNYSTQPHGARFELFDYDPNGRGWYVYTTATVSPDGKRIVGDKPFNIYQFSATSAASSGGTPPAKAPKNCADCTCSNSSGKSDLDPVSCHDGLFIETGEDLHLSDIVPINLSRTYRNEDANQRDFGVGTSMNYDMYLYFPDMAGYSATEIDLVLANGGRIPFKVVGTNTGYTQSSTVYQSTVPGQYYKATLHITGDSWGYPFQIYLRDGTIYNFSYYSSRLLFIEDRYGNRVSLTRDGSNRISRITSPNGRYIDLAYGVPSCTSCISTATDYVGRQVSYSYDDYGHLLSVTNPENGVTSYTYDNSTHRMLTVKDPRNNVGEITLPKVSNVYYTSSDGANLNGRVKSQTFADGTSGSLAYEFDANGNTTQTDITHERGDVRRLEYNTDGFVTRETLALGTPEQQVTTNVWDPTTKLLNSTTDALNRTTAYTYDSNGNTQSITYMKGTSEEVTWGYVYEQTYNQMTSSTDPLGRQMAYTYDPQGNLTDIKNVGNNTHVSMTYYANGLLDTRSFYSGTKTLTYKYVWDGADLVSVTDPLGHSVQYFTDALGRVAAITDPANNLTFIDYDKLDNVIQVVDPLNHATQFSYDLDGNLKTLTDANSHTTSYSYDARNRRLTDQNPTGQIESYAYDAAGNLNQITDRKGQVSGRSFDALNRITLAGFGATTANPTAYTRTINYTYDAGDRLLQANDSVTGAIDMIYDGLNRLLTQTGGTGRIDYSYYSNGLRKTQTVLNQPTVNYAYDNGNRLNQIAQGSNTVTFTYDEANRRSSMTLPNGVEAVYNYDDASQLTGIIYSKGGTAIGDLTYAYDATGRRIQMGGSLAAAALPQNMTATYDANNRISQFNGSTYTYDANGNLVNDSLRSYIWDATNRLMQINGSATAAFQYDAFNRRISKTVNGTQTGYMYDGVNPVQEQSAGSVTVNLLTGGIDEYFTRRTDAGTQSYLTDALGSTVALSDSNGGLATHYMYDAYGNTSSSGTASDNSFQYTGRENDGTGLYYYRARYYDPHSGRFVQSDPIGFDGGLNLYAYVEGDPLTQIDPLGLANGPAVHWIEHPGENPSFDDPCGCFAKAFLGYAEAGVAATEAATGPYVNKPRGGIAGGGPAGGKTSALSSAVHAINKRAGKSAATAAVRSAGRIASRAVPYAGTALFLYDVTVFDKCMEECDEDGCKKK